MTKVRATRHNGRVGKAGIFKAGHNDRSFNLENAGHIDSQRTDQNIYWDCYQGFNIPDENGIRPERKFNFDEIEHAFYMHQFGNSIDAQNERHRKSRHNERIREVKDILKDPKMCPEETIYQLGTKDGHEDPALFAQVVAELIQEIQNRYGSHLKVLDWALHMDEETPHIHERHVFFADDGYGMDFPKQDKALEALGFERPDPEKKQSKINNRKMVFDAEIRELFIELAEKHGITIERIPLEGKTHLEKNDFILSKQREEMVANEAYIEDQLLRMSDIDAMAEDIADKAYEKACEVITDTVKETTIEEDINIVNDYKKSLTERNNGLNDGQKNLIKKVLNNVIQRLTRNTSILIEKVKGILANPEIKRKNKDEIAKVARESIFEKLEKAKKESDEHNASRQISHKQNSKEGRDR